MNLEELNQAIRKVIDQPNHYNHTYRRELTQSDYINRCVTIKLDHYRIAEIYGMQGGVREQILKKALRWTTKCDTEKQVIKEIMQACTRRLEMLEEDGL